MNYTTELLEAVVYSCHDGIVVADVKGNFLLWNTAAEEMVGIGVTNKTPEEWSQYYGCYKSETGPEVDVNDLPLVRAMRGEVVTNVEIYMKNRSKPQGLWLSINGSPLRDKSGNHLGGVICFRDITEKKQVARMLCDLNDKVQQRLKTL